MVVDFDQAQVFGIPNHGRGDKGIRICEVGTYIGGGIQIQDRLPGRIQRNSYAREQAFYL